MNAAACLLLDGTILMVHIMKSMLFLDDVDITMSRETCCDDDDGDERLADIGDQLLGSTSSTSPTLTIDASHHATLGLS